MGYNKNKRITFNCDFCDTKANDKPSSYIKKTKHFCSTKCYGDYRRHVLPFNEQPAYRGIRKVGETKQIYHARYCKSHPQTISHLKARRYARQKNAVGSHTLNEWNDLKKQNNYRCVCCRKRRKLTKDHISPLSKGGTDYIYNIQPLCRECNSRKNDRIVLFN